MFLLPGFLSFLCMKNLYYLTWKTSYELNSQKILSLTFNAILIQISHNVKTHNSFNYQTCFVTNLFHRLTLILIHLHQNIPLYSLIQIHHLFYSLRLLLKNTLLRIKIINHSKLELFGVTLINHLLHVKLFYSST